MESLIETASVAGVLDVTTTEWADELVGGVLAAGPTRLEAAARRGVPAVVSTGCLDMVNFGTPDSVPTRFAGRRFYPPQPPGRRLQWTTPGRKRPARPPPRRETQPLPVGPVSVLLPLRGGSLIGAPGGPFHDPEADATLYAALKAGLRADIPVRELDCAINDPAFAEACADALLAHLGAGAAQP